MRRRATALLAALVLAAALAGGCGQDGPGLIPEDDSEALVAAVDEIEDACSDEEPRAAQDAVDQASAQVTGLPRRVDEGLRENLREWLDHVSGRLNRDCEPEEPEETPTPEPEPTETATPEPEPTETATPEPTAEPTETPAPTEEPAPEDEGGAPAPDLPEEVPGE